MPTGEPPHKIKGSGPKYLPQFKVVWKKCYNNIRMWESGKVSFNKIVLKCKM